MKRLIFAALTLLLAVCVAPATQNTNSSNTTMQGNANAKPRVRRGPVFRANKEQIKQAQSLLKQRGFYAGEETGKLDDDTRAGLKKYQEAETMKITGTLNRDTLQKMNITLTDKQKDWKPTL
ncbi:MAG: peptidoglycan-binding domain-containing protein [Pyrinomonadaceae bacterium]